MSIDPHRVSVFRQLRRAAGWLLARSNEVGDRLALLTERLVTLPARGALWLAERMEGIELVVVFLGRPFVALWGSVGRLASVLLPPAARRPLVAPLEGIGHVARRLARALLRSIEWLNLDAVLVWLVWLLRPVWYPAAAVLGFANAWLATRRWRQLVWGVPTVVMLLPVVLVAGRVAGIGSAGMAARYRLAVEEALAEQDYGRAQLFERKLAQLGVDTRLTDYNTAVALAQEGRLADARARMERLAPVDEPGYPPAHLWLVQRLVAGDLATPADERRRLTELHLAQLRRLRVDAPQLDLIEAAWLVQAGQPDEAADLLQPLVHRLAEAAAMRMEVHAALGRFEAARRDAQAVRNHMQQRQRRGPPLSAADYQAWAVAEELLGSEARLRAVVNDWREHDPQSELARRIAAALAWSTFEQRLRDGGAEAGELAAQLCKRFELGEDSDDVKRRVAALYAERSDRPEIDALWEELAGLPDLPAALAETLGTAAAVDGQWEQARGFLEHAVAGDSTNAVAWNNLACVLLQLDEAPLETALAATNRALERQPEDFRFRETRGQVLIRLARWEEAVEDLEFALNGMPDLPAIHRSLADAYEALGNGHLAAVHRQRAD